MKQLLESQICQALDDHSVYRLGLTVVDWFLVLSDALHDFIWSLCNPVFLKDSI